MTTYRRNVALVIEGMGSSTSSTAGIAWHFGRPTIGTPGNYEWRGGTGSREGLIRPPDSVACSVDRFECQLQGNAHSFTLHASPLAKALFFQRPSKPRDVLKTALSDSATTLEFNGDFYTWSASDEGSVAWIGDEAILLGTYAAGPQFTGCTRGFWSTLACGQPAGMNVYTSNPKVINRRAQLMVYDRDAGTTTQAWQGFVQSMTIDNGIINVSCQDVWSRVVGAQVNRGGRPIYADRTALYINRDRTIGGAINLRSEHQSRSVQKESAADATHYRSYQVAGAVVHGSHDQSNGVVTFTDAATQLQSRVDPELPAESIRSTVHELFVVDRILDVGSNNTTGANMRSSTRYLDEPYHPVAISMALLTSSWSGFETAEAITASVEVTAAISESYTAPPPDPVLSFDESSAKWQDTGATVAANTHGDPIARVDNDGSLGGYFYSTTGSQQPTLDTSTMGATSIAFDGSDDRLEFASSTELTPKTGQGFEVFVTVNTTDTTVNAGVCGKWNSANQEWVLQVNDPVSPFTEVFFMRDAAMTGGVASVAATQQILDGNDHVLHARITTGDDMYLSVDGVDVDGPDAVSSFTIARSATFTVGRTSTGGTGVYTINGSIRAVRVYDTELTPAQRATVVSEMNS